LERAISVVNFTPIVQIGQSNSPIVAAFQDAIREQYPLFEESVDSHFNVHVNPDGTIRSDQQEMRKAIFRDIDRHWTVSLTQGNLALDVGRTGYVSWADYGERLGFLLRQFQEVAKPSHVLRLGVRYLNAAPIGSHDPRYECNSDLTSISGQEGLGIADLFWQFDIPEGRLLLRSGLMPAGISYDPNFFALRDEAFWYLDIDAVSEGTRPFEVRDIQSALIQQAKRLHCVYSWAMTKKGGDDDTGLTS
jgi:uncharacterized protein (TIGR04255 family)